MTAAHPVTLSIGKILAESGRLAAACWPWLCLWAGAELLFVAIGPAQGPAWLMAAAWLIRLYVLAAWLSAMYRSAGFGMSSASPRSDMFRVWLASLLVAMAFGLAAFFLFLFLMIFSLILVAVSGYDPTQGDPSDPSASIEVLRSSGTIWLLYALGLVGLGGLGWMALRLVVFVAATIDRGRVRIFRTWGWTRGHWPRLALPAVLFVGIPLALGTVLAPWLARQLGHEDAIVAGVLHVVFTGAAILSWTALAVVLYPQVARAEPDAPAS